MDPNPHTLLCGLGEEWKEGVLEGNSHDGFNGTLATKDESGSSVGAAPSDESELQKSAEALLYLKTAARSCIVWYCPLAGARPAHEKPEILCHPEKIEIPMSQEGVLNTGVLALLDQGMSG